MIGVLWRRLKLLLARDRATQDVEQEMEFHRQLRAESLERYGHATPLAEAARRFGSPLRLAEESRDAWGFGTADATVVIAGGMGDSTSQAASQTMSRFLNRLPTVTVREGSRLKIDLTSDLTLPRYEGGVK